jgi:uncharacterized protein (TIGR00661 family)
LRILLKKPKKILFTPLDWGLGHASRCIPLIRFCLEEDYDVYVAATDTCIQLIKEEFPSVTFLPLPGYQIQYATSRYTLPWVLIRQLPRILFTIRKENRWIAQLIAEHHIDIVISDNRYGCYSANIPSYFITHQLQIQVPQFRLAERLLYAINKWFIRKYNGCLVPDYEDHTMSGRLTQVCDIKPLYFLGNLSRFENTTPTQKRFDVMLLLSGPEPQRSILEQTLMSQLNQSTYTYIVVRGRPLSGNLDSAPHNCEIHEHLPSIDLQNAIHASEIIICRSGYSTIMDLIKLSKHAILVPTPGQTEQEYLGDYLSAKNWFLSVKQENVDLEQMMNTYKKHVFTPFPDLDMHQYKPVLQNLFAQH